jgi:hypothetical protein
MYSYYLAVPITVATKFKTWNVFALSDTGVVGLIHARSMNLCLRLFCVCVALCR